MRNGQRVWDADTHVSASAETLEPFLSARVREMVPDLEQRKVPIRVGLAGEVREEPFKHSYRLGGGGGEGGWGGTPPRTLGQAGPREGERRRFQTFMGTRFPTEGGVDNADIRIKDMDEEGVDVHTMVPSGANGHPDQEVEQEFIRAGHRFLDAMCGQYPHRLKSLIVCSSRNVEESVKEIQQWGKSSWAVGVQPYMPLDYPIDHPDMEPIWKAAQEHNLPVVHHSFASGYPGYRDLWANPFIGRSASHPWAAMRFVAAMCGSGILDRFPELRFGILESGFGWLPFWANRLNDQAEYVGYVAEDLKRKPGEYMTSGRFFASIEMHEGPDMMRMVTEIMGEGILMFGSDYPHAESRFPESVDRVLAWRESVSGGALEKMMWDNSVRFFGEP
jgi:predicted TIM-barrel fold metal-dependent hydrolase